MKILPFLIGVLSFFIFTQDVEAVCKYPEGETIVFNGGGTGTISFSPPTPDAELYEVRYRESGSNGSYVYETSVTPSLDLLVITPSVKYEYQLRTKCGGVWLPYSGAMIKAFVVPANNNAPITCVYPVGETFIFNGDGTGTVSFSAVTNAESYEIRYHKSGTNDPYVYLSSTSPSFNLTQLISTMKYDYQLRTKCGGTWLPYSGFPTKLFYVPAFNSNTCEAPSENLTYNADGTISVSWAAVSGASNYQIIYRVNGTGSYTYLTGSATTQEITNITPNIEYEYKIRSYCSGSWMPWADVPMEHFTVTVVITCEYPSTNLVYNTDGTVNLTWDAVPDASNYEVHYRMIGDDNYTDLTTSSTTLDITSLIPNTEYEYQTRSYCTNSGEWLSWTGADVKYFTVEENICESPSENLTYNADGTISVYWDEVEGVSNYRMRYRVNGAGGSFTYLAGSATVREISNLTPDIEYQYQIQSYCSGSWMPWANAPMKYFTVSCGYPDESITYNMGGKVIFKWDVVPFATSYQLKYREKGTSSWTSLNGLMTTRELTNLIPDVEYEYRVRTKCGGTWLALSGAPIKTFVVNESPDNLEIKVIATSTGNSIIIRWAPINYETWNWGNTNGYELVRYTLEENGELLTLAQQSQSKIVLGDPLLPLPEAEWEPLVAANEIAGIAAGAIHGSGFAVEDISSTDIVSVYNVQKENENRFGLSLFAADQSLVIAEAMGIAYTDNAVVSGKRYLYRVKPKNVPSTTQAKMGVVSISLDDIASLPAPTNLSVEGGDLVAQLSWDQVPDGIYTSYEVERSSDNGNTFIKINKSPVIYTTPPGVTSNSVFYVDSLGANNQEYIYRVKGMSSFGILSPASETATVQGKPKAIGEIAHIASIDELQPNELTINWRFSENMESKIQGFDVYRCRTNKGLFTKINTSLLSVTTRSFLDANPESVNYYVIKAIDENGYELSSFPSLGQLNDETPPAAPTGLSGVCDASGMVTLTWEKNQEADLMGYRVFISNDAIGDFSQVTEKWIPVNNYNHQINIQTLTKNVFYKVIAVDFRENFSDFSEAVTIARPDVVPPVIPVFKTVISRPAGVTLTWIPSSSSDLQKHVLQRKSEVDMDWEDLLEVGQGQTTNSFIDETALTKYEYGYRVLAYDEANNISSSKIITAKPIDTGIRGEIENIGVAIEIIENDDPIPGTGVLDSSAVAIVNALNSLRFNELYINRVVTVFWSYPDAEGLYEFQIYKKINGGALHTFKTIKVEDALASGVLTHSGNMLSFNFIDLEVKRELIKVEDVKPGTGGGNDTSTVGGNKPPSDMNSYSYVIQAKYIDGGSSPLSNPVSISF